MKIAAAYIRVSTDDQIEYSPSSQIEKIREYAKRNDYILPDEYIFIDEGISGRHTNNRISFNKMIGTAKQKPRPFDAILLWKFSRFARNREDSIVYKSMLRKQLGIDVISISENVGDDKMSVLIEALIEAMDEYYSINLAEEVRRGMTEKASRGEPLTIAPIGYRLDNKQLVINEDTAPIIQRIFSEYLNGVPMLRIATSLNDEGYRTTRGNKFENRTVEYILNNPVYVGKIRWTPTGKTRRNYHNPDSMIVQGQHQPIIDIKTWDLVQKKLKETHRTKNMRETQPKKPFMLQGLVRCDNCGSTLCNSQTGYLQCHGYAHGRCKISHAISVNKINKLVLNSIEECAVSGDFVLEIKEKPTKPKTDYQKMIDKQNEKLSRIMDAYENGVYSIDEFKTRKYEILKQIEILSEQQKAEDNVVDIEVQREKMQSKIKGMLPALRSSAVPEHEKNAILKSFISRIVFYRPSNDVDIFFYT